MKVLLAGKEYDLQLKNKHIKKLIKLQVALQGAESDDLKVKLGDEYLDALDAVGRELTGLSEEEFDELVIEDLQKVTGYIAQSAQQKLNFGNPSQP